MWGNLPLDKESPIQGQESEILRIRPRDEGLPDGSCFSHFMLFERLEEETCDESDLFGRSLQCSGDRPNEHSVRAILWATRWLLLLWLTSRGLLRAVAA